MKTIVLFFYEGHLSVSPSVYNLILLLKSSGYHPLVLSRRNLIEQPNLNYPFAVKFAPSILNIKLLYKLRFFLRRFSLDLPLILLDFSLYYFSCLLSLYSCRSSLYALIGIDTMGSAAANLFSSHSLLHLFLSLEIPVQDDLCLSSTPFFFLSRKYLLKTNHLIIQDDSRLQQLCNFYGYSISSPIFIPNSPIGFVSPNASPSYLFRSQLRHPQNPLVLAAGMIDPATYSLQLVTSAGQISDTNFVLHERAPRSSIDPYIQQVTAAHNPENTLISLEPLPFDQIDSVYSDCDLGLVYYSPDNPNFSEISFASGKLAYFMKHSKPVILNNIPSFQMLLSEHNIGVLVNDINDPTELGRAINYLILNYHCFVPHIQNFYRSELEFSNAYLKLEDALQL